MSVSSVCVRPDRPVRRGFTLIELVVVMSIAAILMSIAFAAMGQVASQRSAQSARDTYIWMGRRARAAAIQLGMPVRFTIFSTGRAVISKAGTGSVIEQVYFDKEFGTTVALASDSVAVQYDPRGLANLASAPTVSFTRSGKTGTARVQLLGQVEAVP